MFISALDCSHDLMWREAPPLIDDIVWCPRCHDYRRVHDAAYQYRVVCRSCTYTSRSHLRNEGSAYALASQHQERKRTHRVEIRRGRSEVVLTLDAQDYAQRDAVREALAEKFSEKLSRRA